MANLLAPSITIPTRINSNGGTLIDNIFTNSILPEKYSGNLSVSISDHLPSFLIIPIENKQHKSQKTIHYKRDTENFSRDDFILDYLDVDWDSELDIGKNDVNNSTEKFFSKMSAIIDKHMPIRKLSAKENKQRLTPWITPTIISKINIKNKLYKKFIKSKNRETKHQFTQIKNEITSLTRKSKEEYYKKYFEKHDKNSKKYGMALRKLSTLSKNLPLSHLS